MALASRPYPLTIDQGARFYKKFLWRDKASLVPIDLTGYKAHMQVRETAESDHALLTLSTESITKDGSITLGGATGTIELEVVATNTAAIDWKNAVYDLELFTTDDDVIRLIEGPVLVSKETTRV